MVKGVNGIHKNLKKLLSIIGGYDYKYHAAKIAKDYNLKTEDVIRIMEISETRKHNMTQGLFNMYFNMLRDGVSIQNIELQEKERSRRNYDRIMQNPIAREIMNTAETLIDRYKELGGLDATRSNKSSRRS